MNELLEKDQVLSIVPQNFKNSNKGKVLDIQEKDFVLETFHTPEGIAPKKIMEFYSQTKNGMLYFESDVKEIKDNLLTVSIPIKHRFLQRRAYTRIAFTNRGELKSNGQTYSATAIDLSAGGIKLQINEKVNIDSEYDLSINLLEKHLINCKYEIIKIERNEDGSYTLSGRFKNLENTDKMKIIQFCMRKNIENVNR